MRMSIKEYAELNGVCYKTIYRMIQAGKLPAMKVGGHYRIDSAKADAILDVQEENASKQERRMAGKTSLKVDAKTIKQVSNDRVRRMCNEIKNGTYGRGYSAPWLAGSR